MAKRNLFSILVGACLPIMVSCSITTLNAVWKDPSYQGGKFKKVLVIGIADNQVVRRLFEDEFTAKLKAHETEAISSYSIIPREKTLDKETVESEIKTFGYDAVLLTAVFEKKTEINSPGTYYPPPSYYRGWYYYYDRAYRAGYPPGYPGYYSEVEVVTLETNLYDTQTGRLIWSALSDTPLGGSVEVEIESVVKVVVKSLADSGLI